MTALAAVRPAPAEPSPVRWRPPPFCRTSWTSEASRALWEPRLRAARDAVEDLAVLRCADDGRCRIAFVRPASRDRLCALAVDRRLAMAGRSELPLAHYHVAAGRHGRLALIIGDAAGRKRAPVALSSCEDSLDEDPVWRLASVTPGVEPFDEGRGLRVAGSWASNPLLAPVGLAVMPLWPESFACPEWEAEGEALLASADAHGRAEAIGYLREALSWPVSWSALHGVAEVKTPVFRFIRDTSPTAHRLSIRRLGAGMPEAAARGLGFPFAGRAGTGGPA